MNETEQAQPNGTGASAIANIFAGIQIHGGAANNVIGGTTSVARNLISGNAGYGITIDDGVTKGNTVTPTRVPVSSSATAPPTIPSVAPRLVHAMSFPVMPMGICICGPGNISQSRAG